MHKFVFVIQILTSVTVVLCIQSSPPLSKEKPEVFYLAVILPVRNESGIYPHLVSGANLFHPKFAVTSCRAILLHHTHPSIGKFFPQSYPIPPLSRMINSIGLYAVAGAVSAVPIIRRITATFRHPDCETWSSENVHRLSYRFDLGLMEFTEPFQIYKDVASVWRIPMRLFVEAGREVMGNASRENECKIASFGNKTFGDPVEGKTGSLGDIQRVRITLETLEFCAVEQCGPGSEDEVAPCRKNFVNKTATRCAVADNKTEDGSSSSTSWDIGGAITCAYQGQRYFWGLVTSVSDTEDHVITFVPYSIILPYTDNFLQNFPYQPPSSSANTPLPITFITVWAIQSFWNKFI